MTVAAARELDIQAMRVQQLIKEGFLVCNRDNAIFMAAFTEFLHRTNTKKLRA